MKGYSKPFLVWLFVVGYLLSGYGQINAQSNCKKIAFVMSSEMNSDIYTICPDGSNLTNLTNDEAPDSSPSWSRDGSKIAFTSSHTGNAQIYVMGESGSNPTKLTSDYENDFPIWLPDDKQIAFRTTDGKGLWWWRIVNIESKEITRFSGPSLDFFFQTPAWSPDGQNIAYMSLVEQKQRNDGSSQIHIKNVDGSNDIALTSDTWANISPIWSPDSAKIAFLSERDGKYNMFALYIMDKNGNNIQKLTEPIYPENIILSWSPDGQQIAISNDILIGNISIIDIKTGKSKELLHLSDGEGTLAPSWQP